MKGTSSRSVVNLMAHCLFSAMIMSQILHHHHFHQQSPCSFITKVDAFLLPPQSVSTAYSAAKTSALDENRRRITNFAASSRTSTTSSALHMAYNSNNGRYNDNNQRTKRQERVGEVVRTELANILHRGHIQYLNNNSNADYDGGDGAGPLEDELRRRISIVNADVSPDLRRARITISILGRKNDQSEMIDKRRAYAWLVRNTKSIRHALSSKMKHMKGGSPELTFVQVDVGAAVDVMNLIDKVSRGYKREDVGDEEYWKSMMMEMEEEEDGDGDEDDGWIDEDEDDFEGDDYEEEDGEIDEESEEDGDAGSDDNEGIVALDEDEDEWLDFDEEDK